MLLSALAYDAQGQLLLTGCVPETGVSRVSPGSMATGAAGSVSRSIREPKKKRAPSPARAATAYIARLPIVAPAWRPLAKSYNFV